jgi:hypothetical protein
LRDKNLLIELIYDEDLVEHAESLYNAGAVGNVLIAEQGLYTATVTDGIQYETEIQSPFASKQKATCDCVFYRENNMCKHIIAFLFELREIFKAKAETHGVKVEIAEKKHTTLNISNILQAADHDELVQFMRNYARTDKKFATQLKVHFARKIDLEDNILKYRSILNTLVRPHTGQASKASAGDIRTLAQVLDDFGAQIDDCLALEQYREAFNIFEPAFSKLEYVRHYYGFHKELLDRISVDYHSRIKQLLKQKLPPDLKTEILSFLTDLANRSYYHYLHPVFNIIQLLLPDKELKPSLSALVLKLSKEKMPSEGAILMALHHRLAKKITKQDMLLYTDNRLAIKDVADHLLEMGEDLLALKLMQLKDKPNVFDRELSNRMLFLYIRLKDKKSLLTTAAKAFVHTGDFRYFEMVQKAVDADQWKEWLEDIETAVAEKDTEGTLRSRIYRKADMWQHLAALLQARNNLELLQSHDTYLYRKDRKTLIELYKSVTFQYLNEHIGDQAVGYIKKILRHLKEEELHPVIISLKTLIDEHFSHRPGLSECFV